MSKIAFQAKVTLNNATAYEDNIYRCVIAFADGEGIYQPRDILVEDIVMFDTGMVDPGTYTRYVVTEVHSVSWTGEVELSLQYLDDNASPGGPPFLDFILGTVGVIARPSEYLGLLPVVSPLTQDVKDTYSFYLLNYNLIKLLDAPRDDGGGTGNVVLKTTPFLFVNPADGRAALPFPPIGDFVLNMGIAYLVDGSSVEITDIMPVQDTTSGQWYAQVPMEDLTELDGMVGAITVSYLTTQ